VEENELAGQITPLLVSAGLELYDLEVTSGTLRVTVTRPGGVDLDALSAANSLLSGFLDEHDPMPGRYTLEVSSPGLERRLRTPSHFAGAVGEAVTLRISVPGTPAERVSGTLRAATDDGIKIETETATRTARYDQIERARTAFSWGAAKKPSPSKARAPKRDVAARGH
jgi:ribosome maturation factor RimP